MAINFGQGFNITSSEAVDVRILKTKAEMASMTAAQEKRMPDNYFCICKDDGKLYIWNKTFEKLETTGRFRLFDELINIAAAISKVIESPETKEALEKALAQTMPGVMKETLEDPVLGPSLVENMFADEHFELNVQNKVDLAISHITAIDGN